MREKGRLEVMSSFDFESMLSLSRQIYKVAKFQEAVKQPYDLIIMNGMANEAFLGVAHRIGAPFILMTTMPSPATLIQATGNYLPSASVPYPMWEFTDKMTFAERFLNFFLGAAMDLVQRYVLDPKYEEIYRENLGEDVPGAEDILRNVSLIFMNTHISLNAPRPNLPDTIEIGGLHCRHSKPLPKVK